MTSTFHRSGASLRRRVANRAVVVGALVALVATACGGGGDGGTTEPEEDANTAATVGETEAAETEQTAESVGSASLGLPAGYIYAPAHVADRLGYDEDEGLDLEVLDFASGGDMTSALLSGSIQFALTGFDRPPLLREEGQDLRATMAVFQPPVFSILANPELEVPEGDASEVMNAFRGQTFGVPGFGGSSFGIFLRMLEDAGMTQDDLTLTEVGLGSGLIAAMEAGAVDGVMTIEPDISTLQQLGYDLVLDLRDPEESGDLFNLAGLAMLAQGPWVDENMDVARAAVRAMVRGQEFLREDPEAIELLAEIYPDLERDQLELLMEQNNHGFYSQIDPVMVDSWQQLLVNAELLEEPYPFEELVVTELEDEWESP